MKTVTSEASEVHMIWFSRNLGGGVGGGGGEPEPNPRRLLGLLLVFTCLLSSFIYLKYSSHGSIDLSCG